MLKSAVRGEAIDASPRSSCGAPARLLLAGAVALAAVRLALAAYTPIIDDEGYYWIWSRHLRLSYLDHPPLVAWLDAAATAVVRTEWSLRLPAMAAGLAATGIVYLLGRDLFDRETGVRAAALHLAVPVFALQALHAIPDPLLYVCWAAATWAFWRAVHGAGRGSGWWWATGAAVGLGVLSKYSMLLWLAVPPAVLLSPRHRPLLRAPGPYIAGALALALTVPVLAWNAQHGWASVWFWLRAGGSGGPPAGGARGWDALGEAAVQLGYGGPVLFPLMAWALWRSCRLGRGDERFAYLALAAIPTVIAVAGAGLLGVNRPNWLAPAYLAGVVAAGALWPAVLGRAAIASGLVLSLAAAALIPVAPWLPPAVRWDELYGWREVTAELLRRAGTPPARGTPGSSSPAQTLLIGQRYNQAGYFGYYTGGGVPVTTRRVSEFSDLAPPDRYAGWNGLAAVDAREPVSDLRTDCRRLIDLAPYDVPFPGGGARRFRLFRCVGYRGTPPLPGRR